MFGREIVAALVGVLGDELVGVYFVGSVALGGYVGGESDIDVVAVCRRRIDEQTKTDLVDATLEATARCPARGLEFTLYRADIAGSAPVGADFEVNINGGPRMARDVHPLSTTEPGFWYVLDRAIAHRHGVTIVGPPAAEVVADVGRPVLLEAMGQSMTWHRRHEKATLYSVLNAARAWRFAVEDVLGSKLDGAAWARRHWPAPWVIDAAVELRHGRPGRLDVHEVDRLLDHVGAVLAAAL